MKIAIPLTFADCFHHIEELVDPGLTQFVKLAHQPSRCVEPLKSRDTSKGEHNARIVTAIHANLIVAVIKCLTVGRNTPVGEEHGLFAIQ